MALTVCIGLLGTCGSSKAAVSTPSSTSTPKPSPTPSPTAKPTPIPVTTNYDVCYRDFGTLYDEYFLFDFDSGSGAAVKEFKKHHGKTPSSPGSVIYFTFTGNFEDGLRATYCGNSKNIIIWKYPSSDRNYIYPTYEDEHGYQLAGGASEQCSKSSVLSAVRFMTETVGEKELTGCPAN